MTPVRILAIAAMVVAIYCGLSLEAVAGGRTPWPHVPAVIVILVAWSLAPEWAIVIAALIGLGCDAIGTGLLGPGMTASIAAVFIGSTARARWDLDSALAAALFGMAIAAAFLAGPLIATTMLAEMPLPAATLHLQLARAISSALAATALLLMARIASRLLKTMTGVLLNV